MAIVTKSDGYHVKDDSGPLAGPFPTKAEAELFIEYYSPPK